MKLAAGAVHGVLHTPPPFEQSYTTLRSAFVQRQPAVKTIPLYWEVLGFRKELQSVVVGEVKRTVFGWLALATLACGLAAVVVSVWQFGEPANLCSYLWFIEACDRWNQPEPWALTLAEMIALPAFMITLVFYVVNLTAKAVRTILYEDTLFEHAWQQLIEKDHWLDIRTGSGELQIAVGGRGILMESNRYHYYLNWWSISEDALVRVNGLPKLNTCLDTYSEVDLFHDRVNLGKLAGDLRAWAASNHEILLPLDNTTGPEDTARRGEALRVRDDFFNQHSQLTWESFVRIAYVMTMRVRRQS